MRGADPQTGQLLDKYDCTFNWQTVITTEGTQTTRQTAAALEGVRNVFAALGNRLASPKQPKKIEGGVS